MHPTALNEALPVINLADCEKQTIHTPGSIQGCGILLSLNAHDFKVLQASDNTEVLLGIPVKSILEQPLVGFTGEDFTRGLQKQLGSPQAAGCIKLPPQLLTLTHGVTGQPVCFDSVLLRSENNLLILELLIKQVDAEIAEEQVPYKLQALIKTIYDCQTIPELNNTVADAVRQLTGFERVMLYQFHKDWHGEVLAEAKAETVEPSYLGLHFPASDIPKQARDLYSKTPLRIISDVNGKTVQIVPEINPITQAPLDLSLSSLRSVAPTHTLYLNSMGVSASFSISIFHRDTLWGLLVCHHYSASRPVSVQIMTLCELLGQVYSLQLMNLSDQQTLNHRLIHKEQLHSLVEQINDEADSKNLLELLTSSASTFQQLFNLDGVLIRSEFNSKKTDATWGTTPNADKLAPIEEWLCKTNRQTEIVMTDRFSTRYAEIFPQDTQPDIAGLIYLPLNDEGSEFILGFRKEIIDTLQWFCNLTEQALPSGTQQLGPGHSFKRWQQSISGRSLPFTPLDDEMALHLRLAVLERLNRQAKQDTERNLQQVNQRLEKELVERKQLESQLVQAQKMESLGQLAAGVAHEINNPIGFVKSNLATLTDYVEIFKGLIEQYHQLTEGLKTDTALQNPVLLKQLDALEKLYNAEDVPFILTDINALLSESSEGTERVREIVQHLRSFVRLDEEEWRPANINEGIESTLKIIWNVVKYKCNVQKNYGELPDLHCNLGQLNQVFMNLMVNAAHAIKEQGDLIITTQATDTEVIVAVQDTGNGISPDQLDKIFNPFFTTKPVGQGTGLGLSISYNIIQKHHGRIEVQSTVGEGSTFTVYLPRHVKPA